jgi:hypothetical protein
MPGEQVVIEGTAMNGRAGAVVEADDGRMYYVGGLDAWDRELMMRRVSVTGTLRLRPPTVETRPPDEEQETGLPGETLVLDDATWSAR